MYLTCIASDDCVCGEALDEHKYYYDAQKDAEISSEHYGCEVQVWRERQDGYYDYMCAYVNGEKQWQTIFLISMV